jgi:xanthine dehydrogenase YagT iron-sulfur-binding subunit
MTQPTRSNPSRGGFHRRDFLRGSGAAAAATALATGQGLTAGEEADAAVVGPGMSKITLNVNGADHAVLVEPRMTLLEVLRYQLNLTGAKPISGDGTSGGSTVFVAGKPISASTTLALTCVGKPIQTVESLGGAKVDPVPAAFVHNDGMQCGFCTPGFVMAVRAFLNKHPQATEDEIRAGLNGNICRCGTYANVILAAIEVVKGGARG